jgi:hypothetical protein
MKVRMIVILYFLGVSLLWAEDAKVKYLIGEVRYKQSVHQSSWNSMRLNTLLQEDNVVRTGKESRCELLLPDGSQVNLMDYSMLKIDFLPRKGQNKTDIFALLGNIYFKVKKSVTSKFQVRSPASVALIRGTEFLLINSSTKSEILVKSGQVIFSDVNENKSVTVNAGYKSVVKSGGFPSNPTPMTLEEQKNFADTKNTPTNQPGIEQGIPAGTALAARPEPQSTSANTQPPGTVTPPQQTSSTTTQEEGWSWGVSVGAVTIDNQIYNQIGLRPILTLGKFGMALDIKLYIDGDGNIREDDWDSWNDIIEKIYYIRWGLKGDPFYVKAGAISSYRMGYGLLMNRYSNTIEYPSVIRTGFELGFQGDKFGIDLMLNDFKEIGVPGGIYAGRINFRPIGKLELGAGVVYDRNQYAALKDRDKDGVPNDLDDFPGDNQFAIDTDGDGVPDSIDPDRDGNGYTDNTQDAAISNNDPYFSAGLLKPTPFNIQNADSMEQLAYSVDIGYPVIDAEYLNLTLYAEAAKFNGTSGNEGWGIAAPGFIAKFAFINFYGSYRYLKRKFIAEYFNTTYEIERAVIREDTTGNLYPVSKREVLESVDQELKGFVVGADFNIYDILIFGAEYQNMRRADFGYKTFRADLNLSPKFIPKLYTAGVYYYQQNVEKLFRPNEGTIFGYRLGYEIAPGAALVVDFRTTYRGPDGEQRVNTTNIQTVFTF